MKRVLIATPAKGGIPSYWVRGWESVMREAIPGFDCDFVIEDAHQAINLSRNAIAHGAMHGNYDINVQIDSDHPWTRAHLARILSHEEPIVSGLYAKKAKGDAYWLGLRTKTSVKRQDGLLEADYLPTGFLKVDVAAYRKIGEVFPERKYVFSTDDGKDHEAFELFPIGLVGPNTPEAKIAKIKGWVREWLDDQRPDAEADGELARSVVDLIGEEIVGLPSELGQPAQLLGEDYFFSHLARKAGFKLWLDTHCVLHHMGQAPYPIPPEYLPKGPTDIPTAKVDLSKW